FIDLRKLSHRFHEQCRSSAFFTGPLFPRSERSKHHSVALSLSKKAEPADDNQIIHFILGHPVIRNGFYSLFGTLDSRARGRLDSGNQNALIFGSQESSRQTQEQESRNCHQQYKNSKTTHRPRRYIIGCAAIFFRKLCKPYIESFNGMSEA